MNIHFFFRHKGLSIENVFSPIIEYLSKKEETSRYSVPHQKLSISAFRQNLHHIQQHQGTINHITGDIQYGILAFGSKARTVLTVHDCIPLEIKQSKLRFLLFKYIWFYFPVKRASAVTVISEKTKQELIKHIGKVAEKAIVIHNPVNPLFQFSPPQKTENLPRILHLGTKPNKNLPRLIAALQGIPCHLRIIGQLNAEILQALKEKQIEYSNVVGISNEEIYEEYKAADIVSFISTYEGFGMPIIEAQAVGRPVISSNIEPMIEVAKDSALLVNPWEEIEIRAGISRLLQDENLRKNLVEKGLENVKRFEVAYIAEQYRKVYQQIQTS